MTTDIQTNLPAMPSIDTSCWTAAQWAKHEKLQGQLLVALNHYRRAGWTQAGLIDLLTGMVAFTWQMAEWEGQSPEGGAR